MKFLVFFLMAFTVFSKTITLNLAEFRNGTHRYIYELLTESLKLVGYDLKINSFSNLPQSRIDFMLKKGEIDLHWYLKNDSRDSMFLPIDIGLTNGLIGKRILLIRKGTGSYYEKVKNLEDFRKINKVGGFGKGWYDVKIWQQNNLKYYEQDGDWTNLYKMVGSGERGVDYISRGVNEVLTEYSMVESHVDIEKNLLFTYDSDFIFYMNKNKTKEKMIMEEALKKAKESGLIDKMIDKYYKNALKRLNYENRIIIKLQNPK